MKKNPPQAKTTPRKRHETGKGRSLAKVVSSQALNEVHGGIGTWPVPELCASESIW